MSATPASTHGPVRVCASFHVRKNALPDFCEAAGRVAMQAGRDEGCQKFQVHRELGWTRQISTQAQSLFTLLQEWESPDALEQHVRSTAAMRFDRSLKDGEMLACPPMLSLFGPELSVSDLQAMAAEARSNGSEINDAEGPATSPTGPQAEVNQKKPANAKGYSGVEKRVSPKAGRPRGSKAGAWK
eukprot:symbB.v1.2.000931.t1/scaffold54.1/size375170/4